MFGNKVRKFVVMDGSNKRFLNEIIGLVEMCTGKSYKFRSIKCKKIDRDHPTMMVVSFKTNYRQFDYLRKLLTKTYPEQCVFDAPL